MTIEGHSMRNTTATSTSSATTRASHHHSSNTASGVWLGRLACLIALATVTVVLGFLAHHFLTETELDLAQTQYESITDRALTEAASLAYSVRWSLVTLAQTIGTLHPNAEDWPFVAIPQYETIVRSLMRSSSGEGMSFFVLVKPELAPAWEDFAYDYYYNIRDPPFPNDTAQSSFGRGIFGIDQTSNATDKRYHDTTGVAVYESEIEILAPIFHSDKGADNTILMLNGRFDPTRGRAIDNMIRCSSSSSFESDNERVAKCAVITDMVTLVRQGRGSGAVVAQPIYPLNDATNVTSGIASLLVWDEIFQTAFNDEVRGIDCVLKVGEKAFTYQVVDGAASVVGEGDLHDKKYDHLQRTVVLTGDDLYSDTSPVYTLSIYPNADFFGVYNTGNATTAFIVIIAATLATSLVFLLYDAIVRREFDTKSKLLEAKRRYMRYISHEVRTPLSSVFMGLSVVQNVLAQSLGFESADALEGRLAASLSSKDSRKGVPSDASSLLASLTACEVNGTEHQKEVFECFQLTKEIQQQAQGAVDVLSDLLMYDKIESRTFRLELVLIPIWQLVDRTANEFRLAAVKKRIHFEVLFGSKRRQEPSQGSSEEFSTVSSPGNLSDEFHILTLVGDRVRVTQVIRNLISNAIKFTPEGGTIQVQSTWSMLPTETSAEQKKDDRGEVWEDIELKDGEQHRMLKTAGHVQVLVRDSGAGMTAEQLERLYGEGTQFNVDELQSGGGSGLGLFITKDIVQQHHGSLKASSDGLGKGTTFTLTLPLHSSAAAAPTTTPSPDDARTTVITGTSKDGSPETTERTKFHVLIVEDVLSNRKLLNRMLTMCGHSCEEAENGAVAVEMVMSSSSFVGHDEDELQQQQQQQSSYYDMILLDYEMPVLSGPETAKELRRLGFTMPIVGVTGNILGDDVAYFKSSGANAVLPKPFQIRDFDEVCVELGLSLRRVVVSRNEG